MLIDILSQKNYFSYNVKLASILGLDKAVYISALLNQYPLSKNLDRKLITSLTSISENDQKLMDSKLKDLNIINVDNDVIELNIDTLSNLLMEDDKKVLSDISKGFKVKQTTGKMTNRQRMFESLKDKIICSNDELLEAYKAWIDGVYANPKGFLSLKAITVFQKTVDEFAKGDLDLALKIIEIGTINGYRDATWCINLFNKEYAADYRKQHQVTEPTKNRSLKLNNSKVF